MDRANKDHPLYGLDETSDHWELMTTFSERMALDIFKRNRSVLRFDELLALIYFSGFMHASECYTRNQNKSGVNHER